MRHLIAWPILASSLAGCANGSLNFRPTMGSDAPEIGYEAQALVNELRLAYDEQATCGKSGVLPSYQNVHSESYRRLRGPDGKMPFACVRFKDPAPSMTPQHYYEVGLELSDIYCDDYFRRIADHKQKRQFGRSGVNDIGTAASAALGLATAGSIVTGGAGVAFGLADNLFRNYDAAFLVEPDLGKMLKLVQAAQTTYKASVDPSTLTTLFAAHRAVADYAQKCSYVGMASLLDHAIDAGTEAASIDDTMVKFQTARERQKTAIEESRATEAEKTAAAVERQKSAKDRTDVAAKSMKEPAPTGGDAPKP